LAIIIAYSFIDSVSASTGENLKTCGNKLVRMILDAELEENGENRSKFHLILVDDEVKINEMGGGGVMYQAWISKEWKFG
jgi:hypothetical protein